MTQMPGQEAFPGLEPPQEYAPEEISAMAARIAINSAQHAQPTERISEAYADLGGHQHDLSDEQAHALKRAGLGGKQVEGQVARVDAAQYYQQEFNLTGPIERSEELRATVARGMQGVARVLGPHEFDRASKEAAGDSSRLMALQRARAEKREAARRARS